jgi:predicted secreted protein
MAASTAISACGTLFNWDSADIAELTSISGPSQSLDTIDVTSHDSDDCYREFIAGLRSGGDISIEGNFLSTDTDGQVAMHTDFQAGEKKAFIIKFPAWVETSHEYPQITGNGYVTAFDVSFPFEDKVSFSATIKVTGKPTLTVSA